MSQEKWPWHDESGYTIQEDLFYGIGDSGSMAAHDKATREEAIEECKRHWGLLDSDIGTKPEHLGEYSVTVLSGREYIDRLKVVEPDWLNIYGHWSN